MRLLNLTDDALTKLLALAEKAQAWAPYPTPELALALTPEVVASLVREVVALRAAVNEVSLNGWPRGVTLHVALDEGESKS